MHRIAWREARCAFGAGDIHALIPWFFLRLTALHAVLRFIAASSGQKGCEARIAGGYIDRTTAMIQFPLRIFVAGHCGMVGSALMRVLQKNPAAHIISRTHAELDLSNQAEVEDFFATEQIDHVYLAAAKVGGIRANSAYPADFIYQNLMIAANVCHAAWHANVKRLLFFGSSGIYPVHAAQPIQESALLTGPLESTEVPYAVAKIAGIKLCETYNRHYGTDFRCLMPTNLYGLGANFHPENSHVIPALLRRFHAARLAAADEVQVWGTGTPLREFLYADDLGMASVHVMGLSRDDYRRHAGAAGFFNVGSEDEVSIRELAELIAKTVGYQGRIRFDSSKPDGAPRKRLHSSAIAQTGWQATVSLEEGLRMVYRDALDTGSLRANAPADQVLANARI
jgi:GDP-L-fucose synthase